MTKDDAPTIKQLFGKAIRRRRRDLDITQEELAERADLHRTFISDIERGEANPSLENIDRLAQALEISIVDLFSSFRMERSPEKLVRKEQG